MEDLNPESRFDILVSFIREEIGEYEMEINQQTLIEDDLGVTGDEAIELIQNFGEKFGVDISDFQYLKYFHPEPNIFNTIKSVYPITVGNLYNSLKEGKLT